MGNHCCCFDDEDDLSENTSKIYSNATSTVINAPRISTEENRNNRNHNRIIKPLDGRLPEICTDGSTNYRDHKSIIDSPNRNSIKPPNIAASGRYTERNKNYKVRNKTPDESISMRDINIVDGSFRSRAMIERPTNVSVRVKESTNNIISKPDYTQSLLAEDLPNKNIVETFQRGEKVHVNNSLHRLLNGNYVRCNKSVLDRRNLNELEKLDYNSLEYRQLEALFYKTNKRFFKIHSIEKVHNPYLAMQYELKKMELNKKCIKFVEVTMYHGTKKCNIDSICQKNFDWRLRGTNRGCKFGEGVSFSPISYYATHYGDTTYNKVMIVAHVIVGECCEGYRNMVIPPLEYDTSVNKKKDVYVKYDDNSFYPSYLIHYGGIDEKAATKEFRSD